ncbi:MAG: MerR family transcriptional regulator [Candidatus Eisenbacteria bacterium]|uniref:MerR family transcriptional regulator n=1 Tax=Eiseniibacteriota bacterium TaxID=2212470 RepID=A0A538SQQ6_UNCEI|nr:MAG: MerR family transcriptional regulator [Candidatus Eisenbacteria bacterium]TMQ67002.1 MAG: MerR family transcriptional regulator [Candidatus Eisenbacteria bacterium]
MVGVKPHVLRYWETQFKMLRPKKGRGGARMYRKREVETLFQVKQLLYDQRFTIAGARRKLLDDRGSREQIELTFTRTDREEMLRALRRDLEGLLAILHRGVNGARARARK